MIISVKEKTGRRLRVILPTGLLLNRVTAYFVPGMLEKKGVSLTGDQAMKLIQVLRTCRRRNPGWKLLEAESADGDFVEITL